MNIQQIDQSILNWFNQAVATSPILDLILRIFAEWLVYTVPLILLGLWFWARYSGRVKDWMGFRIKLIEVTLAGVIGWKIVSGIIKALYFRPRPYASDQPVKELFFHRPDESFPSDHTILLFGLATYCYYLGWKKAGHWILSIAVLVSLARITTAIHWPTDILGGAVLGVVTAWSVWKLQEPVRKYFAVPVAKMLGGLGL